MRISVAPFLLPSLDSAQHSGWTLVSEESIPLPRQIEAWDYQAELRLQSGLVIERTRFCAEAGIGVASDLEVLVVARSTSTRVERCILRTALPEIDKLDFPLDVRLDGSWLGGRLVIDTMIVARNPIGLGGTSAKAKGSILWSARQDTILEGEGGLFPTDSEDFRETRPKYRDVPWLLVVDQSDFDSLFTAAVRLTLNTGVKAVSDMLTSANSPESKRLAKLLELDVTRQLARIAVQSKDVMVRQPNPEGESLGDVLRMLATRIWPVVSSATLVGWCTEQPERVELDVQQFVGAFR